MENDSLETARWPLELAQLQVAILASNPGPERDELRAAFWRPVFEALMRCLRFHTRGGRVVEPADLEDISAEKALELLLRAESGAWNLSGRSAPEI